MMRKSVLVLLICNSLNTVQSQENTIAPSMDGPYRKPVIEEAPRNIILQNRCGNRTTMMFFDDSLEFEVVYKPNAYRRKDYRARNFSGRDNFTRLFKSFTLPQIKESYIREWGYDPFVTSLGIKTPWDAKNKITVVNIADENVFAISAKAPLLISVKPHHSFQVDDGLLIEKFSDRGEEIVSFVSFQGFEENRFRVTADGSYILQLFENEVVYFGGEESMVHVNNFLRNFRSLSLNGLVDRNEKVLNPKMNKGLVHFNDQEIQEVIDLNHRIVYSGIDEGGACFGALNRIYYLIWVRDGSMTTSLMARAGNPELIKIWAPFLLNNPSVTVKENGNKVAEFLQIVGSRWTKSEDDGLYYACLSLFTYYQTTGQTDLLEGDEFAMLLDIIDSFLGKVWKEDKALVISDTRGETPLKSNPYFGYDVVNGDYEIKDHHLDGKGRTISAAASLYNMVNTYNILKMASVMLEQRPDLDGNRYIEYNRIADRIENSVREKYQDSKGTLFAEYLLFDDGTDYWQPFAKGADYWEYAWSVSLGPFYPAPDLQLRSARMVKNTWPQIRTYGYCPWNTLSRTLFEHGMSSKEYKNMIGDEIAEARMLTKKYPMPGALTEYNKNVEGWRSLPFSAGSFFFTATAQIIQSMPMGIAVRASNNIDSISNFRFRLSGFDAKAEGNGDEVISYKLNGNEFKYTLQIPEDRMRFGINKIEIQRGKEYRNFRLYSSTGQLRSCNESEGKVEYILYSNIEPALVFENIDRAELKVFDSEGNLLSFTKTGLPDTNKTQIRINGTGEFFITARPLN